MRQEVSICAQEPNQDFVIIVDEFDTLGGDRSGSKVKRKNKRIRREKKEERQRKTKKKKERTWGKENEKEKPVFFLS